MELSAMEVDQPVEMPTSPLGKADSDETARVRKFQLVHVYVLELTHFPTIKTCPPLLRTVPRVGEGRGVHQPGHQVPRSAGFTDQWRCYCIGIFARFYSQGRFVPVPHDRGG